ncbi:bifunctional diaminohydroxyphosphoribosylaminopyrimidine deaminase/5-amino-6-(5-phosphoribosylamino)uracil reductase RibD [Virgibacillus halodenitrificans]|uniref:bifunctional diaminohydroxyphosphoribosylaminopyrimidine deaminase/5-amino-6-(5-phosphoribosylamino)uracil reductase RibD n=1 Tax=Virgibacillus halodenitrificans TaxID=1482 RepID=UPI0013698906|nr:bifunctional diaminohydroxyphosphoribosylaminopyrimidine deaminase/5-amino-6-(5-phosphoribosylamino)uracil reductase RibD [Virgibacillus halodenitrificans]MYL45082.1 bifunctional diaminohydroxyphosphoribosylaminopyrimidine deaminase/5-amino-6-(5-phosphoribosylamino)uracil reductase RibD [Virgibacillus halodenitrificans]
MQEEEYMKLALSMALAAKGQTSPNPLVGAVIVKDGFIVGTGAHFKAGTPHAEIHAIHAAGEQAFGADIFVTLEPCSHFGRTAPCADAIIQAGIKRVYIASLDPNPLVAGKGIKKLRKAGIEVETGLLEKEAVELNQPFFHFIKNKQPFVTIKAATSLDGKIAAATGDSKWITSPESRRDVHQLRHEHDAILVGIHTIIQDNPRLTTRLPQGGKNPIRIILDTHLRIPLEAKVLTDQAVKTIIYTGKDADSDKMRKISNEFVEVVQLVSNVISIEDVLKDLGDRNIVTLLVEGGSEIHASFIEENAFQQLIFYMAPKIIGGKQAIPCVGGSGAQLVEQANELEFIELKQVGSDLKITARPRRKGSTPCLPE